VYRRPELLLQVADAGGIQYADWKADGVVRTRGQGLLSSCERMSEASGW
jgi:hypothetical protein